MPAPAASPLDSPRPTPPEDSNVVLPASVLAAKARAEAYYQQPAPAEPPAPPVEPPPAAVEPPTPQPAPVAPPTAAAEPPKTPAEPPKSPEKPIDWEHRYHAMKGRYDASQREIGAMQEQMSQLGNELMRVQSVLPPEPQRPTTPVQPLLTAKDQEDFGPDVIDFAKRAALEAVTPKLTELEQENQRLRQQIQRSSSNTVVQQLDAQVPNWRDINRNPRFVQFMRLPDIYSGRVRQALLDEAAQAGNSPRVIAFYKGFLQEEAATGHLEAPPTPQPPAGLPPAPREPVVPLESLAAPGRVRPTSGSDLPAADAADKPIITRGQVAEFYNRVRAGHYRGREADKAAHERIIFDAQRDGRIR